MKTFDDQELANCNGQDGRPAYVAHRGKVVDLTGSRLWKGGVHMKRHHAGADLSTDIQAAPHGPEVLERFPQVGVLEKPEAPDRELPPLLVSLLKRYPHVSAASPSDDRSFSDRFHAVYARVYPALPRHRGQIL